MPEASPRITARCFLRFLERRSGREHHGALVIPGLIAANA
jgi:hypothetical protein